MKTVSRHTTAILVFARSPDEEMRYKKIGGGRQLFEALTGHTIKTIKKTGLPFFRVAEDQQRGTSFGERFANAIQCIFEQGFDNVITVGNDSPHLNKFDITKALYGLEDSKSVIGPSADGGIYLLALNHLNFRKSDFVGLPWQTSKLREEIVSLLSESGRETCLLSMRFDIDTFYDLKVVGSYAFGLDQSVLAAILLILAPNQKAEIPSLLFLDGFHSQIPFNKGSPSSFSP